MSTFRLNTWDEPFLPWVQSANDRRFLKILLVSVIVFGIFGAVVPFLPTSEPVKKDLKTVSPRLAKMIMEKRKLPPPPVPKPVKPKAKPKPKAKEKPKAKKKKPIKKPIKKPVKKNLTKKQKAAKKTAASSGLMSMASELNDLRDSFDLAEIDDQSLSKSGKTKTQDFTSPVISSTAMKSSGGIKNSQLSKSTGGGKLASRKTTKVSSNIDTGPASKPTRKSKSGRSIRPEYEIEQVFQKNKSAIYKIYNRALRKDPTLQGKVVIELTIAPNGSVTKARILSSDLNNPKLEKKLIARVKLFRFKPGNSETVTVKYPIDFLPS